MPQSILYSINPIESINLSYASDSGPAAACGPFGLLVCPDLVCLSDLEKSSEVLTSARRKPHCLPLFRGSLVVSCRVFLVHSDDQVFGTLDGAKNAIGSCSSRRDSDANVGARRAWYDLKRRLA